MCSGLWIAVWILDDANFSSHPVSSSTRISFVLTTRRYLSKTSLMLSQRIASSEAIFLRVFFFQCLSFDFWGYLPLPLTWRSRDSGTVNSPSIKYKILIQRTKETLQINLEGFYFFIYDRRCCTNRVLKNSPPETSV